MSSDANGTDCIKMFLIKYPGGGESNLICIKIKSADQRDQIERAQQLEILDICGNIGLRMFPLQVL